MQAAQLERQARPWPLGQLSGELPPPSPPSELAAPPGAQNEFFTTRSTPGADGWSRRRLHNVADVTTSAGARRHECRRLGSVHRSAFGS